MIIQTIDEAYQDLVKSGQLANVKEHSRVKARSGTERVRSHFRTTKFGKLVKRPKSRAKAPNPPKVKPPETKPQKPRNLESTPNGLKLGQKITVQAEGGKPTESGQIVGIGPKGFIIKIA